MEKIFPTERGRGRQLAASGVERVPLAAVERGKRACIGALTRASEPLCLHHARGLEPLWTRLRVRVCACAGVRASTSACSCVRARACVRVRAC
eukprot:3459772-Pleurochrysis_carterae.AAC.2